MIFGIVLEKKIHLVAELFKTDFYILGIIGKGKTSILWPNKNRTFFIVLKEVPEVSKVS